MLRCIEIVLALILAMPVLSSVITQQDTQKFLDRLEPPMSSMIESLSYNISHLHDKLPEHQQVQERAHLAKRSLSESVHSYIYKTFGKSALDSYAPILQVNLEKGIKTYRSQLALKKRDLNSVFNETQEAHAAAQKLASDLSKDFQDHAFTEYMLWLRGHDTTPKEKEVTSLSKRALFAHNNKNEAIYNLLRNFLMIPFFFTPVAFGFGGMLAMILWDVFFMGPIVHKMLFDTWF